jgi:DNA helicase-2/ATP-dependent DNA helicase PcrA
MNKLSDQQRTAVEHFGSPALVIAGAGSGKTRTLTAKIVHLISLGYKPERLLAITFTNKAADEMKKRLIQETGLSIERFPWVRTFHSACFKLFKVHCRRMGFSNPVQIYSVYQQQKTLKDVLIRLNYDLKYTRSVLGRISIAKNSGEPTAYFDHHPRLAAISLQYVYEEYEKELIARNAVDFDNILLLTRDLLKHHPEIRADYQSYFEYILVDEYQDSNNLQEELTRLMLRDGNLFCVGDDWQAIYGFRGSNVNHFLSFKGNHPLSKIFRLEQNYRSADEIVKIANTLIGFNDSRMDKTCFSDKKGGVVEFRDYFDEDEEAEWIGRKIKVLHQSGIPLDQMAVVYRTKFCSLTFERTFRAMNLPYQLKGSKGFFERKEVLDINSYLAAAVFPKDDVAFDRIFNTPRRGIGPGMLRKILQVREAQMSLQESAWKAMNLGVLTPKVHHNLNELQNLLEAVRNLAPNEAIESILERVDYLSYLRSFSKNEEEFAARQDNIEQLLYSASQKKTLLEYLEEASLIQEDKDDEDDSGQHQSVHLMTIHAAKGLEYRAVFVIGCEEQLLPHWRSLETDNGIEEERRLMYVAMTRAAEYLFLSCASYRRGNYNLKSRFIEEIEALL